MISFRGKFWFNILRLFRWRLGALLKVTEQKKQKNKFEFWRKAKNFDISDISFNDFNVKQLSILSFRNPSRLIKIIL